MRKRNAAQDQGSRFQLVDDQCRLGLCGDGRGCWCSTSDRLSLTEISIQRSPSPKYLLGVHASVLEVARMMLAEMLGCFTGAVLVWAVNYPTGR